MLTSGSTLTEKRSACFGV